MPLLPRLLGVAVAAALPGAVSGAWAQEPPPVSVAPPQSSLPPVRSAVLVIRREALFEGSVFGKAARARFEVNSQSLIAENREIEKALEAEERELTDRRARLSAEEFRSAAEAFDAKVEEIRAARDARSRDITRGLEEDRQRFLQAAIPILAQIMAEFGATVILDQQTVVVNLDVIDVTEAAIARIDAAIGDGSGTGAAPSQPGASP